MGQGGSKPEEAQRAAPATAATHAAAPVALPPAEPAKPVAEHVLTIQDINENIKVLEKKIVVKTAEAEKFKAEAIRYNQAGNKPAAVHALKSMKLANGAIERFSNLISTYRQQADALDADAFTVQAAIMTRRTADIGKTHVAQIKAANLENLQEERDDHMEVMANVMEIIGGASSEIDVSDELAELELAPKTKSKTKKAKSKEQEELDALELPAVPKHKVQSREQTEEDEELARLQELA